MQVVCAATDALNGNAGALALYFVGWDVDSVVNVVCIFLSFDFNDQVYERWCCVLHKCCARICGYRADKKHGKAPNDLQERLIEL